MSLATEAKQFLRTTQRGILSTISTKFNGYPFGSVTPFILDHSGSPVILISTLAEHTKNIIEQPKVSLIVFNGEEDLQANARLTLLGEAIKVDKDDAVLKARYLRYHPQAEGYFDMHDFQFYRIQITQARYIAGFGKMGWLEGNMLNTPFNTPALPLASQEPDIVKHMNEDHVHSMLAYCAHFHHQTGTDAKMLGIDTDGFDVQLTLNDNSKNTLRFNFDTPIHDAGSARKALVGLSNIAVHQQ